MKILNGYLFTDGEICNFNNILHSWGDRLTGGTYIIYNDRKDAQYMAIKFDEFSSIFYGWMRSENNTVDIRTPAEQFADFSNNNKPTGGISVNIPEQTALEYLEEEFRKRTDNFPGAANVAQLAEYKALNTFKHFCTKDTPLSVAKAHLQRIRDEEAKGG